jgi:hypothetical protein
MAQSNSKKKDKNIGSRSTLDELATAIASLGNRTDQRKDEIWGLNHKTRSPRSLWGEFIYNLDLDHSEVTRQVLYKIWRSDGHEISGLVEKKKRTIIINENDGDEGSVSVPEEENSVLLPDPSLPLPQRPNTRASEKENDNDNSNQSSVETEISVVSRLMNGRLYLVVLFKT